MVHDNDVVTEDVIGGLSRSRGEEEERPGLKDFGDFHGGSGGNDDDDDDED